MKLINTIMDFSNWRLIKHGVPQGSILGLLLFNVDINDFSGLISRHSDVGTFADGTSILISNNDNNDEDLI